jgi:hypothetical protein
VFLTYELLNQEHNSIFNDTYMAASHFGILAKFVKTNENAIQQDLLKAYNDFTVQLTTMHGSREHAAIIERPSISENFLKAPGASRIAVLISIDFSKRRLQGSNWD